MTATRRQQSHERILDAATRALFRGGYAGVGVASVMKEAGLTHGGFYAHFDSREALLAETLEHAGAVGRKRMRARCVGAGSPLRALLESYLSPAHVDSTDEGCLVAALAGEMARTEAGLRAVSAQRVTDLVDVVEQALPAGSSGDALVIASTMIGAVQIARVLQGEQKQAVLKAALDALLAQYDRAATAQ
jgi:AcrR family transcriptional regulator